MCRILESIIRNYKQTNEQDRYSKTDLVHVIENGDKTSYEKETEEIENTSSMFYQPTDDITEQGK